MNYKNLVRVLVFFLGLLLFSGGFFAGYVSIQNYFTIPEEIRSFRKEYQEVVAQRPSGDAAGNGLSTVPFVAQPDLLRLDLVCVFREKLCAVVITALDCSAQTLTLYTVPLDTKLALTESQYQEISASYPALPQLFLLRVLDHYMAPEEMAKFLQQLFASMFQCRFASACAVSEEDAAWLAQTEEGCVFSEEAREFFSVTPGARNTLKLLQEWQGKTVALEETKGQDGADGTDQDTSWLRYAETLAFLTTQACTNRILPGEQGLDGYQLQTDYIRQLWYPR